MKSFWLAAALVLLVWANPAAAAILEGRVVGVADGDTVTVLDADNERHRIRLSGIDAPERRQPFSQRSKQMLSDLVYGKEVAVHWDKRDRYGRIVGRVLVAEAACEKDCVRSLDTGLALVRSGLAWWYRYYAKEQPPEERKRYEAAETQARQARVGLWSEPNPTAPWDYRKSRRKKK
ncbi:thermonuclease family protein [Vulgatibacter sp.]|uniref:thermonuclease family protein n=1 Tax=Vulgatibacter sp. TaxID=1971226 RepID=UPI00356A023A